MGMTYRIKRTFDADLRGLHPDIADDAERITIQQAIDTCAGDEMATYVLASMAEALIKYLGGSNDNRRN